MKWLKQLQTEWHNQQNLDSPVIIWGSLLSVAIILWALILTPYLQWREQEQQQLHQNIRQLSRLQALQKAAGAWQQAEQNYQQAEQQMLASFFQESSYVTAQAALLKMIRTLLKKNKIKLDSQRLHESESEPIIGQRITLTLRLHGKLVNIIRFIHALNQNSKLLNIDKLYLSREQQTMMPITLQISGFRLTHTIEHKTEQ